MLLRCEDRSYSNVLFNFTFLSIERGDGDERRSHRESENEIQVCPLIETKPDRKASYAPGLFHDWRRQLAPVDAMASIAPASVLL